MRRHPVPPLDAEASASDDGFTLVETLVALCIVTVALFALTASLTAYLHHQAIDKSRTTAVRLMTTSLENARRLPASTIATLSGSYPSTDPTGKYTTSTVIQHCSLTDSASACTAPSSAANEDVRVRITVSWLDGTKSRSVSTYTSIADDSTGTYSPTGSGTLSTLVGGTAQSATAVTVSTFTASPTTTTVSAAGVPAAGVALTMTTVGLTGSTTSIPVTWTDDNGSHQWSLTGGPNTWNATVPAASIKKVVTSGTSPLTFAATVPGTSALPTATVTLRPAVSFTSCSVSPNPIVLTVLTRKTAFAETLTCTVTGLASTDSVTVTYPSQATTATKTLTSATGTTWSVTLPAATFMANGLALTEAFTFTATRASDGLTATSVLTAVLA